MSNHVSVVLPVFNGAKYLSAAIESVLSQTYSDFELLISNDCSDDQSPEIIKGYAQSDKRIIAWRNDVRKGLFGNYNECLRRASGEFIKPFAQDDILHPEMLEKTVRALETHSQVALVSVARRFIDPSGKECADSSLVPSAADVCVSNQVVAAREVIQKCLFPVRNIIGEPASVLFRKGSIDDGFDEAFHHLGDLDYWFRILRDGDFFCLPEELVECRWHDESATHLNESQLLILPDVWRLGGKHQSLLETLGHSLKEYEAGAIINLAKHVDDIESCDGLKAENVNPQNDVDYFRAIALHALRALAGSEDSHHNAIQNKQQARLTQIIHSREQKLQALLASQSWKATKIFRDINRLIGASAQEKELEQKLNMARQLSGDGEQREYLKYLRQLHRRVTRSRSWSMTKPFRPFGWKPTTESRGAGTAAYQHADNTTRTSYGAPEIIAKTNSQNYLAAAAIFRNEAPYLEEWLEFHRLVGVEKFYLFNNLSTDDFSKVPRPYIDDGIVELIDWPIESSSVQHWNSIQCTAYNMAARLALGNAKWLAFLDVDEFLFPLVDGDLKRLLLDYESYGGLCANWRLFGTSNVRDVRQSSLMIENLTRAAAANHPDHFYVKSIIQPERVSHCIDPHTWMYKPPFGQVTSDGLPFCGSLAPPTQSDKLRINHYRLRDEIGYEQRKQQRYAAWNYTDGLSKKYRDELNEVEDRAILRFVPELRAKMKLSVECVGSVASVLR